MDIYVLSKHDSVHDDPRNLFALRWDLHNSQFDNGSWVIVPKANEMVVHFIKSSYESAALYHNHPFDTTNLSIEFIYARFAWAIIGLAKGVISTARRQRFRLVVSNKDPVVHQTAESIRPQAQGDGDVDMVGGEIGGPAQTIGNTTRLGSLDATTGDSLDYDTRKLAEDLEKAARTHPFFRKCIILGFACSTDVFYPSRT
jgi:hypothetical protein